MTPPEGKASAEDQTNEYTKTPQVDDDIEEAKDDEIIEVEDDVGAPSASNNKQMSSPEEEVKFSKLSSKEEDDDNNNDTKIEPEKEPEEAPTPRIRMTVAADAPIYLRLWEVFTTFWPLGFIAFGGPQAHIALLRDHLVVQRDWIDEESFQELFALGQALPGPSSTQLVCSLALARAGPLGGLLAFTMWSLPGLVVLTAAGVIFENFIDPDNPPWYLIGLPAAAISLVFFAFYLFAMKLDKLGTFLALFNCITAILVNNGGEDIQPTASQWVFPVFMVAGGLVTLIDSKRANPLGKYNTALRKAGEMQDEEIMQRIGIPMWVGILIFLSWIVILAGTLIAVETFNVENDYLEIFEVMFRIGSIIYGGGQVVLPMLQDEIVPYWMTNDQFLQGLGLSQSMPGPLFNFASYCGAVFKGVPGSLIAFLGLFGPGVILIFAIMPFWVKLRNNLIFRAILSGVNASAIGLVGAACVILWESAIVTTADAMIFSICLTCHVSFAIAAPFVIIIGFIIGAILSPDALNLGQVPYCGST